MININDIEVIDKRSYLLCKYVTQNGSVIKKKYTYTKISEALNDFKAYINANQLF